MLFVPSGTERAEPCPPHPAATRDVGIAPSSPGAVRRELKGSGPACSEDAAGRRGTTRTAVQRRPVALGPVPEHTAKPAAVAGRGSRRPLLWESEARGRLLQRLNAATSKLSHLKAHKLITKILKHTKNIFLANLTHKKKRYNFHSLTQEGYFCVGCCRFVYLTI